MQTFSKYAQNYSKKSFILCGMLLLFCVLNQEKNIKKKKPSIALKKNEAHLALGSH